MSTSRRLARFNEAYYKFLTRHTELDAAALALQEATGTEHYPTSLYRSLSGYVAERNLYVACARTPLEAARQLIQAIP